MKVNQSDQIIYLCFSTETVLPLIVPDHLIKNPSLHPVKTCEYDHNLQLLGSGPLEHVKGLVSC